MLITTLALTATLALGVYPPEIEPFPQSWEITRFPCEAEVKRELKAFEVRIKKLEAMRYDFEKDYLYDTLIAERIRILEHQARPWYHLQEILKVQDDSDETCWCYLYNPEGTSIIRPFEGNEMRKRVYLAILRDMLGRGNFNAGQLPSLHFPEEQ